MTFLPVATLKDQARRLTAYLGDRHRFRLKDASALEAVAAMNRQPDWNTLHGLARRAETLADNPLPSPSIANSVYPLGWNQSGPQYEVPAIDWKRHVLTRSRDVLSRREWLKRHLVQQLERQGAGVFVNLFGGQLPDELQSELGDLGGMLEVVDLGHARSTKQYNLIGDLPPGSAADLLLLHARRHLKENSSGQQIHVLLEALIASYRAGGIHVSLSSLLQGLQAVAEGQDESLAALDTELQHVLQAIRAVRSSGPSHEADLRPLLQPVIDGLEQWAASARAAQILSDRPDAPSLVSLFCGSKCVLVEMAPQGSRRMMEAQAAWLMILLGESFKASSHVPRDQRGPHPRVLGLAEAQDFQTPGLASMLAQGRSVGWTLLMTTSANELLDETWLTGNVWNHLHLDGLSPQALAAATEHLARATSALVAPGSIRFDRQQAKHKS